MSDDDKFSKNGDDNKFDKKKGRWVTINGKKFFIAPKKGGGKEKLNFFERLKAKKKKFKRKVKAKLREKLEEDDD